MFIKSQFQAAVISTLPEISVMGDWGKHVLDMRGIDWGMLNRDHK